MPKYEGSNVTELYQRPAMHRSFDAALGTVSVSCVCGYGLLTNQDSRGYAAVREFERDHTNHTKGADRG